MKQMRKKSIKNNKTSCVLSEKCRENDFGFCGVLLSNMHEFVVGLFVSSNNNQIRTMTRTTTTTKGKTLHTLSVLRFNQTIQPASNRANNICTVVHKHVCVITMCDENYFVLSFFFLFASHAIEIEKEMRRKKKKSSSIFFGWMNKKDLTAWKNVRKKITKKK